jgi:hypothetical protein
MFTCAKCNQIRAWCWKIVLTDHRVVCAFCFPDYFTLNAQARR